MVVYRDCVQLDDIPHFFFFSFSGFNLSPMFPPAGSEIQQASGTQASPNQQPDPNMSLKTEYMSFPPPLQRTPLNNAHTRYLECF